MANTIEQIKKEMERLEMAMREITPEIKAAKSAVVEAKLGGDKSTMNAARESLEALMRKKDSLKSDWYLMNAEKMEKEKQL
jgi:hypothetical protein